MYLWRAVWHSRMDYFKLVLRVCGVLALLFAFNIPLLIFFPEGIQEYLHQLFFIFATMIFAFGIDGMKIKDLGLELRGRGAEFGFGLGLGTIQILGILLIHWIFDTVFFTGLNLFDFLYPAVIYFTLVAVAEEMFFRGYLLNLFSGSIYKALIISALIFAVGHPINSSFDFILYTLWGIAYGYMYLWSGSLWLPIGAHLTWNLVLTGITSNFLIISPDFTTINSFAVIAVKILGFFAVRWFLIRRGKNCAWSASLRSGLNPKLLTDEELRTEEELNSAANTDIISPGDLVTEHAGFWGRVLATLIDGTILLIPSIVIGIVLGLPWLILPLVWVYGAVLESGQNQATYGKLTMGFFVTDFHGRPLSFGRALLRRVLMTLSFLTLGFGFLLAGWSQHKQGLHDLIAFTLVKKA